MEVSMLSERMKNFGVLAGVICLTAACGLLPSVSTESIVATAVADAINTSLDEFYNERIMPVLAEQEQLASSEPTPYPTYTPAPTYTSQPSYSYSYQIGTPGGCLSAVFISENVPDNTVFNPGETFVKTWTIKNTGYCTWNTNYKLVFYSGDDMDGDHSTNLPEAVSPGEEVDLSVTLTAPNSEGTYRGDWRVCSDTGVNFARFWAQIKVEN